MRKGNTPVVLLLAIGIFILLGLQIGEFITDHLSQKAAIAEQNGEKPKRAAKKDRGGFENVARIHSKTKLIEERLRQSAPVPLTVSMPTAPHNLTEGPLDAKVTLTIFNDPACLSCNKQVADVLRGVDTGSVRVVHKFFPSDAKNFHSGSQHAGVFQQLAIQYNVWPQINRALNTRRTAPILEDWADMFTAAGVDLTRVRHDLKNVSPIIMRNLERDRQLAEKALVESTPTFFINDFLIDGKLLALGDLQRSIARLNNNQPVLNAADFLN